MIILRAVLCAATIVALAGGVHAQQQPAHADHAPPPKMAQPSAAQEKPQDEHAGHQMPALDSASRAPIPPVTDEDRAAAFPDVAGHAVHDNLVNFFILFDQLEWRPADDGGDFVWDNKGWVGGDVNRMWFRTEGGVSAGELENGQAHVLYGRAIARWWDVVGGVRQDLRPGPGRTWAAVGIQGIAPHWFEIEATGYLGESGRTHARVEVEYELLLTNRLIAQPLIEIELYGRPDPERRIGAGLSSTEMGIRIRYERRRELAPYVGVTWERKFGETRELALTAGSGASSTRVTFGVRAWF